MTPTKVRSGQTITGTGGEQAWDLTGPWSGAVPTVTLRLKTGSYRFTTAPTDAAPVISDTGFTVISTAEEKDLVSWTPGIEQLRTKGTFTVHVSY